MKLKDIVLRGFLLNTHSPDAESLSVELDCSTLPGDKYLSLIKELEDLLTRIDEDYAEERHARGRSLRGKYRRLGAEGKRPIRTRKLRFLPIPSPLATAVKNLRRTFYADVIHKNCLTLKRDVVGQTTRALYLVPYAKAPLFMLKLAELNKKLDAVNERIQAYLPKGFERVNRLLKHYSLPAISYQPKGFDDWHIYKDTRLHPFAVDLTPISIDPDTVKELLEQEQRKAFEHIKDEEREGLEMLRAELERQRREVLVGGIQQLQQEITTIVARLLTETKLDPDKARADLERLRELAESSGLEAISKTIITPLIDVCDNPLKAAEVFGDDIPKGIDGRFKALIKAL